jgi:DGQHR domain-containing protein
MATSQSLKMPVIRVEQPVGEFYLGAIDAKMLLEICHFDYRKLVFQDGYSDFLGIQRDLSPKRVQEISRYIDTADATFPTSVVISVDEKCARINESCGAYELCLAAYTDGVSDEMSVPYAQIATIIDGQHRLKGFEKSKESFMLNVAVFIGIDDAVEAEIFSTVNLAQTKVNKSLTYDLFSLARHRSPEKTCHEITVALDRLEVSPFHRRIKRLGQATEGRFGETLSQATIVKGMLPYLTRDPLKDRDIGRRFGFWDPVLGLDAQKMIFAPFFRNGKDEAILAIMINYFNAIKNKWPDAWASSGRGVMISRTNGYNAFMRFLRHAYLDLTTSLEIPSEAAFASVLRPIKLVDSDFITREFVPGTGGATALYHRLVKESGLG